LIKVFNKVFCKSLLLFYFASLGIILLLLSLKKNTQIYATKSLSKISGKDLRQFQEVIVLILDSLHFCRVGNDRNYRIVAQIKPKWYHKTRSHQEIKQQLKTRKISFSVEQLKKYNKRTNSKRKCYFS